MTREGGVRGNCRLERKCTPGASVNPPACSNAALMAESGAELRAACEGSEQPVCVPTARTAQLSCNPAANRSKQQHAMDGIRQLAFRAANTVIVCKKRARAPFCVSPHSALECLALAPPCKASHDDRAWARRKNGGDYIVAGLRHPAVPLERCASGSGEVRGAQRARECCCWQRSDGPGR